jgi:hypothetical protein
MHRLAWGPYEKEMDKGINNDLQTTTQKTKD